MSQVQAFENTPPLKLHQISPLFYFLDAVKEFALLIIIALFASSQNSWAVWGAAFAALFVIPQIIGARFFKYWILPNELVVKSGIFFKQERHIPYERIQNINQTQGILHRLFKVCKIQLESASGTKPEAIFNVISLDAIVELRLATQGKAKASADPQASVSDSSALEPQQSVLLSLPLPEVVKLGLITLQGLIPIAVFFGFISSQVQWWDHVSFSWLDNLRPLLRNIEGIDHTISPGMLIVSVLSLLVVGLIVFWFLSIAVAIVRFYQFTLTREDEKLSSTMGLITRVSASAALNRIQKITISEGILHRVFNRVAISCKTAGNAMDANTFAKSFHYLAPIIHKEKAPSFLNNIQKEFDWSLVAEDSIAWKAIPYRAWTRMLKLPLLITLIAACVSAYLFHWWALGFVLLLPLIVYDAQRSTKAMGYIFNDEFIAYRSGWISKEISVVKIDKSHAVAVRQNPFDKRRVMAKFYLDTAGVSISDHKIKIKYLDFSDAIFLQKRITELTNKLEFKW